MVSAIVTKLPGIVFKFDTRQLFWLLSAGAFVSFLYCLLFLKEPKGSFSEDYHEPTTDLTAVDSGLQFEGVPVTAPVAETVEGKHQNVSKK